MALSEPQRKRHQLRATSVSPLDKGLKAGTPNLEGLYLETIKTARLDFDFEKVCSVSLAKVNVYACLVCSRYFQGRGPSSVASLHALNEDHHVFMNLETLKVYLLPENREVCDQSPLLDSIRYAANPTYTPLQVATVHAAAVDLNGKAYRTGYVGINNISANDYANVVLQLLGHIPPLRDHFLLHPGPDTGDLQAKFGLFVRKMWSARLFRAHLSPHELLQWVSIASKNAYTLTVQKDPKDFMVWMLNHLKLKVLAKAVQGKLRITTQTVTASTNPLTKTVAFTTEQESTAMETKFWLLTLDLPPQLFFKDTTAIAQCSLLGLLAKYNGHTPTNLPGSMRRYSIIRLPKYLILHFNRFPQGVDHKSDRNPVVVKFPLELDMAPYVEGQTLPLPYRLLGNAVHELVPGVNDGGETHDQSLWKVQLEETGTWMRIHDLHVEETERELLFLEESYLQIWARV